MDHKIVTAVGTAALIAGSAAAQAAPTDSHPVEVASNYSQLLEPISNATQRLKAADAQDRAKLVRIQYNAQPGVQPNYHHHHHHSNDWYTRNGYVQLGGRWVTRDYYNHHHHHHHSNYNNNYNDR